MHKPDQGKDDIEYFHLIEIELHLLNFSGRTWCTYK